MEKTVYIRLRHRVFVQPNDKILVKDIAQIIAEESIYNQIKEIVLYQVKPEDRNIVIIDIMQIVEKIKELDPAIEVQLIGQSQTIIEVVFKKRKVSPVLFLLIWFLLFFGSMLTIMNFHEDVSMQDAHQRLYKIITGENVEKPLLFQIPYSLGLGLGMIIFFNHVFKKRLNEEPSPLEVEMFNYQQDLDRYVVMHENKERMSKKK
ncbi:stage V sporulation protein AA [Niallia sp. Krafla_26]|uniref:stage V sporulation protein AA n=1 Tax=Niallia sp. Krafla_26 TaxID=3064703 RepID=UPI003D173B3B